MQVLGAHMTVMLTDATLLATVQLMIMTCSHNLAAKLDVVMLHQIVVILLYTVVTLAVENAVLLYRKSQVLIVYTSMNIPLVHKRVRFQTECSILV